MISYVFVISKFDSVIMWKHILFVANAYIEFRGFFLPNSSSHIVQRLFNLLSNGDTYMGKWTGSSFVHVMAWRMLSVDLSIEPISTSSRPLGSNFSEIWIWI